MCAIADHVGAFERAAGSEFVGDARRIADGEPVDAVAQRCFRSVCHEKLLLCPGFGTRDNLC